MLTTDQKGAIAEAAIAHAAVKLGIGVARPIVPTRYDYIFDLGDRFLRVQCKSAVRRGEVVVVWCRSRRRGRDGMITRPYTAEEIDAIAAHCDELDRCYLLPLDQCLRRVSINLRLAPTRNGQRRGVLWARDFEFESLDWCGRGP